MYIGGFEFKSWPGGQLPCCWTRVRLSGFVLHPLIPSFEVGGISTRVAQKVLKPLIYFRQNQFFRWLILNTLLAAAAPWNKLFSCTCTGGCLNAMVW